MSFMFPFMSFMIPFMSFMFPFMSVMCHWSANVFSEAFTIMSGRGWGGSEGQTVHSRPSADSVLKTQIDKNH